MSKLHDLAVRLVCRLRGHDPQFVDSLSNQALCARCLRRVRLLSQRWWVAEE